MRVVVNEFMSLDGVFQAPGMPQEDTSGGFRHGGWSGPYFDPDVMGAAIGRIVDSGAGLLQGATTYRLSSVVWPERAGQGDAYADWINTTQKYVVSDTLTDSDISWQPTKIIRSAELVTEVSALRRQEGGDLSIYGSLSIVRTLLVAGLVDELTIMIEPITLGGGKRLFPNDQQARRFELISSETAATGVIVCRYRPVNPS